MLHIYQMILLLGTLPIFCCIQLFLVFKCIGVSSHRKKVFWLIIIYTIIFKAVEIGLELVPEYHTTLTIQITHSLVHAFNTFILLTIIGIYGEGYFPRNFIKTTFYYDFLSTLPCTPTAILTKWLGDRFLPPNPGEYCNYPAGCIILLALWMSFLLTIMAVYYLFGKKLNWLFSKIPDWICLAYFLLSFVAYVSRLFILLSSNNYMINRGTDANFWNNYIWDFSYALLTIILLITILLARATFHRKQLQRLQILESTMLLDYYQNVSMLHGSIRSLRHDLSNHLAVPEEGYRESLLRICKEIDGQIHRQLAWQPLDVPQLSSREKYEIYQYVQQLLQKKKLPTEALCITTEENQVSLAIDTTGRRSLHPALLRSSSFFRMLQTILKQHNGTATWQKGENSCTLHLHF